jgi:hypothetical protein
VSDRGLPIADGAHACPFVAFDDDRDERADVPDHRHRCYADSPPAPRALAHQEADCLSSAFPVCPTFQDWARREAAKARGGSAAVSPGDTEPDLPAAAAAAGVAGAAARAVSDHDEQDDEESPPPPPRRYDDGEAVRNPPREWSAPPPWLASAEAAGGGAPSEPPSFLASRSQPGQGLAGSTADQWAGGPAPSRSPSRSSASAAAASAAAAGAASPAGGAGVARAAAPPELAGEDLTDDYSQAPPPRRPRAYDQHLGGPSSGPDWERPRRYEAYPTIRTRVGLPQIPRLAVMAAALGIAAIALFFLPALLGLGSPEEASATPSPTPMPSRSIEPTPTPEPTPATYVIRSGDTLSKIAAENGLTLEQLMAANPDIKDPNKIAEGQQIIIPVPQTAPEVIPGSAAPSAGASP